MAAKNTKQKTINKEVEFNSISDLLNKDSMAAKNGDTKIVNMAKVYQNIDFLNLPDEAYDNPGEYIPIYGDNINVGNLKKQQKELRRQRKREMREANETKRLMQEEKLKQQIAAEEAQREKMLLEQQALENRRKIEMESKRESRRATLRALKEKKKQEKLEAKLAKKEEARKLKERATLNHTIQDEYKKNVENRRNIEIINHKLELNANKLETINNKIEANVASEKAIQAANEADQAAWHNLEQLDRKVEKYQTKDISLYELNGSQRPSYNPTPVTQTPTQEVETRLSKKQLAKMKKLEAKQKKREEKQAAKQQAREALLARKEQARLAQESDMLATSIVNEQIQNQRDADARSWAIYEANMKADEEQKQLYAEQLKREKEDKMNFFKRREERHQAYLEEQKTKRLREQQAYEAKIKAKEEQRAKLEKEKIAKIEAIKKEREEQRAKLEQERIAREKQAQEAKTKKLLEIQKAKEDEKQATIKAKQQAKLDKIEAKKKAKEDKIKAKKEAREKKIADAKKAREEAMAKRIADAKAKEEARIKALKEKQAAAEAAKKAKAEAAEKIRQEKIKAAKAREEELKRQKALIEEERQAKIKAQAEIEKAEKAERIAAEKARVAEIRAIQEAKAKEAAALKAIQATEANEKAKITKEAKAKDLALLKAEAAQKALIAKKIEEAKKSGLPYNKNLIAINNAKPVGEYAIEMIDITKTFNNGKIVANKDLTFKVKHNEIHAIVGENGAGKSTLMSILFGIYKQDSGTIKVNGSKINFRSAYDANMNGIGMVHQHFKLVSDYTLLENIVLGSEATKGGFINMKPARNKINNLIKKFNLPVNLDQIASLASVGQQQRTEILKLLYRDSKILIFDEPTAVLSDDEISGFLKMLLEFKKQGKTIILITHKLNEVKAVADSGTVIRKGELVGTFNPKTTPIESISKMMMGSGKDINKAQNYCHKADAPVVLEVQNLYSRKNGNRSIRMLKDLNLKIRAGEIYGLAGIEGNGQSELALILGGLFKADKGKCILNPDPNVQGKKKAKPITLNNLSVKKIYQSGVSHVPEDRHKYALFLDDVVALNAVSQQIHKKPFSVCGFIRYNEIYNYAKRICQIFDVQGANNGTALTRSLSGGNQQKLVIGREITRPHRLIIYVQPTRGLDVNTIKRIHKFIVDDAKKGAAVLLISYELDEIFSIATTVGVMDSGKIVYESLLKDTNKEHVGKIISRTIVNAKVQETKEKKPKAKKVKTGKASKKEEKARLKAERKANRSKETKKVEQGKEVKHG